MCSFVRPQGETYHGFAPVPLIVWMSLRPAIPWRVALLHSSPPLYRPESILNPPAETVNHHLSGAEEFSTGVDSVTLTSTSHTPLYPSRRENLPDYR